MRIRKLGAIEVEQVREECEERIKEHPYVGWAREETGVDVGFRHRRVGACRKHRGVQGLGACHGAKWGMDDVSQESEPGLAKHVVGKVGGDRGDGERGDEKVQGVKVVGRAGVRCKVIELWVEGKWRGVCWAANERVAVRRGVGDGEGHASVEPGLIEGE